MSKEERFEKIRNNKKSKEKPFTDSHHNTLESINEELLSDQKFQSRFSNGDVIDQSIESNSISNSYQILLKNTLWNLQLQPGLIVKVFKIVSHIEYKLFDGNLSEFLDYMNSDYSEQILVEVLNEGGNNMDEVNEMSDNQNAISTMITNLIQDEWEAAEAYNSVIASIPEDDIFNIKNVLSDIVKEEYMHIGQLEAALKEIDNNADQIDDGEVEGSLQLDESVESTSKFILDESLFEEGQEDR